MGVRIRVPRGMSLLRRLFWFLAILGLAVMSVVFFAMYQLSERQWKRFKKDLPSSPDEVLRALWGTDTFQDTLAALTGRPPDPWDAEQHRRKVFMAKVCYEVREAAEVTRPSPKELLQYMVLDNADQVLFCPSLEDAAATDWQRVLEEYAERALRLEKYARGEDSWESARDEQVDRRRAQDQGLVEEGRDHRDKFRDVINAQSVQEVLSSYYMKANTKVLLVEHPFERLLSFYLETIRDKVGKTGKKLNERIIDVQFKDGSETDKKTRQVSFSQFVRYLLHKVAHDPHMRALYYVCHPCDVRYDYIIKMETFHEDIEQINRRIHLAHAQEHQYNLEPPTLPPRREFSHFNLTDETWIQQILYDKYKRVKKDNLLKAFDLFSVDMFLFNYTWPFKNLSLTKRKRTYL